MEKQVTRDVNKDSRLKDDYKNLKLVFKESLWTRTNIPAGNIQGGPKNGYPVIFLG